MGGAAVPGFSGVHQRVAQGIAAFAPGAGRWVDVTMGVTGFAAAVADAFLTRRARVDPPDPAELYARLGDVYRKAREDMRTGGLAPSVAAPATAVAAAPVNITINAAPVASKYLASEGAEDVDTGCLPCGKAHLGAMQGMLERAAEAADKEGGCGPECGQWMARAAQEPVALFARDWTPERIAKTPLHHRALLEQYVPKVRQMQSELVGQDVVTESLVRASALLSEATRFAGAGDGIEHPEVQWRLAEAEKDLTTAERAKVGAMTPEMQQRLRRLRQKAYNDVAGPDDVTAAAAEADVVAAEVQSAYTSTLTPEQVRQMAEGAKALRASFRSDLGAAEKAAS